MDAEKYYSISIQLYRLDWQIIRLIWIAFYKNQSNNDCLIDTLPKDVINYIIQFIGILATTSDSKQFVLKL